METNTPVDWVPPEPVPLRLWPGGSVRVGKSRVGFNLVVHHFNQGETPEEIVHAYETLKLADVYGAIAYYLRHKEEVDATLKKWEEEAEVRRAEHEAKFPPIIRAELVRRFEERQKAAMKLLSEERDDAAVIVVSEN
jgi:uncharacterized protein (DUF433 family)